ncbi:MAG: hypothetical protein K2X48_07105 [Chitinophagaceae bacterium]|nr:hypothetical protein [Chitinophagaceae bacterium]
MQKELLQKSQVQVSEIGKHIGFEAGEEMVKRFYDKHPEQAYSHIVGRDIIEKILAQPGCAGIGVLPAYNENGTRQVVFVGLDNAGTPILKYNVVNIAGALSEEDGLVADNFKTTGWSI